MVPILPFPNCFSKSKKEESEKEIPETFKKFKSTFFYYTQSSKFWGMQSSSKNFVQIRESWRVTREVEWEKMCLQYSNEKSHKNVRIWGYSLFLVQLGRPDLERWCLMWEHPLIRCHNLSIGWQIQCLSKRCCGGCISASEWVGVSSRLLHNWHGRWSVL